MYLARAFERRATATTPATPQRGARPPQRPGIPVPLRPAAAVPAAPVVTTTQAPEGAAAPARPFRRLSPAEQLERRRQGLCYNCDEPYVRGHVCQRLFYLEAADFLDDDIPTEVAAVAAFPEEAAVLAPAPAAGQEPAAQPQVPSTPLPASGLRMLCSFQSPYMAIGLWRSSTPARRTTSSTLISCAVYTSL